MTKASHGLRIGMALTLLSLAACHGAEAPTAPVERPLLERTLHTLDGMSAQGIVMLPDELLLERAGIPGVFVLTEPGTARFRMVKTGKQQGDRIGVTSGLRGDEILVGGPYDTMLDGSPIRASGN